MKSRAAANPDESKVVTIRVPFSVRKRGGRKFVIVPDGAQAVRPTQRADSTLIKALARAHRWKRMLEGGMFSSVAELARVEKINVSYVCRILRLTLLAPKLVEAILEGRQPLGASLPRLSKPFPLDWNRQELNFS